MTLDRLNDVPHKSDEWYRRLDQETLNYGALGPRCPTKFHANSEQYGDRVRVYGAKCRPVRERLYRCRDCGTLWATTEKVE